MPHRHRGQSRTSKTTDTAGRYSDQVSGAGPNGFGADCALSLTDSHRGYRQRGDVAAATDRARDDRSSRRCRGRCCDRAGTRGGARGRYASVYDRAQGKPWPNEFRARALRNDFVERWQGREDEMLSDPQAVKEFEAARRDADYRTAHIYAGQAVGLISQTTTAGAVVGHVSDEAERCLRGACALKSAG